MKRNEGVVVAFPRPFVEVTFPAWPAPARTVRAVMHRDTASWLITFALVPVGVALLGAVTVAGLLALTVLAPVLAVVITLGAWRASRAEEPEPPTAPPRRTPPVLLVSSGHSRR